MDDDPLELLRSLFTHDEVVTACDRFAAGISAIGLCWHFAHVDGCEGFSNNRRSRAYVDLPRVLDALGGKRIGHGDYYWPIYCPLDSDHGFDVSEEFYEQRLTMLAFMLTWLEDE